MDEKETPAALERELLQTGVRHDPARLNTLLADHFREFGSSGRVFSKPEITALLADESPAEIAMEEVRTELLAETVALVTYRVVKPEGATSLRSSLWVRGEAGWRIVFHQGTKIAPL